MDKIPCSVPTKYSPHSSLYDYLISTTILSINSLRIYLMARQSHDLFVVQNVSFNKNLETKNDLFDRRELAKFIKFCPNQPIMILLHNCQHCNVHACQKMDLIQQCKLNLHSCILGFKSFHTFGSKRCPTFEIMLHHG